MMRDETARYGRYIGRVGALAVALGVGAAVATGYGAGIAVADDTTANESGSSETGTAGSDPGETDPGTADESDAAETDADAADDEGEEESPSAEVDDEPEADEETEEETSDEESETGGLELEENVDDPAPTESERPRVRTVQPETVSVPTPAPTVPRQKAVVTADVPSEVVETLAGELSQPMLLSSSAPEVVSPVAARVAVSRPVLPDTALDLVSTVVSMVLSQVVAPGPVRPPDPTVLWVVVGWVRREIQRTFFNEAPSALPDDVETLEDTSLVFDPTANDSDDFRDVLTVVSVTQPENGSVMINPDGTLTYTPNGDFDDTDTFTYTVTDEGSPFHLHGLLSLFRGQTHTTTQTVTVTVTPVNDAPVADNDSYAIDEDETLVAESVLVNDSDLDNTAAQLSAKLETGPEHGTLSLQPDGTFTYTPDENYYGSDKFTYRAFDGTDTSNLATVTITVNPVNDAPNAVDDNAEVNEGGSVIIDVVANDTDPDGNSTINSTSAEIMQPAHGTASVRADGTIMYASNGDEVTSDSFTYTIRDASNVVSDIATVYITVTPVNDGPPTAKGDGVTVAEGGTATVSVLANDTDPDGNSTITPSSVTIVSRPSHGTATVNATTGSITYVSNGDEVTSDSFSYTVADVDGAVSQPAIVTVTITPVNDGPPRANGDTVTVLEGGTATVNVLTNDTDPDGNSTIAPSTLAITTQPTHGTVSINADHTITYVSNGDEVTSDSFSYTVADADGAVSQPATVTVTITPVNDPPVQGDPAVSIVSVNPISGLVTGRVNVTDPDSTLSYSLKEQIDPEIGEVWVNEVTGAWTFTPTRTAQLASANGLQDTVEFEITATDGTTPVPVTVIAPIDPAEGAVTDTISAGFFANDVVVKDNRLYITSNDLKIYDLTTQQFIDTNPATSTVDGISTRGADMVVNGDRLYILNNDAPTVTVVDLNTNKVIGQPISVPAGMQTIATAGDMVYATSYTQNSVTVINRNSNTVVGTFPTGANTFPWSTVSSNNRLYVTGVANEEVMVLNNSGAITSRITGVSDPHDIVASGDRIYVANYRQGTITVIDTVSNTVVDVDPSTTRVDAIAVGSSPSEMKVVGDRLYVVNWVDSGTVTVVDLTTNKVVDVIPVGAKPVGLDVKDGKLYVANQGNGSGSVSVITLADQAGG